MGSACGLTEDNLKWEVLWENQEFPESKAEDSFLHNPSWVWNAQHLTQ